MALVTPKHTGELYTFFSSLEVLSNHESWIDNETFKNELFELYVENSQQNEYVIISGKPAKKHDESDYTKDLQLPMYFGFAEADSYKSNSSKRITKTGRQLLNAYKNQDNDIMLSLFLDAIKNCSFGRNNFGCIRSDSDYEAPAILFRSIILLNGVSTKEFAYILNELDNHGRDYSEIISELSINREVPSFAISFANLNTDMKFITLLSNLGFILRDETQKLQLSPMINKAEIYQIPIMNTEKSANLINEVSHIPTSDIDEINISIKDKYRPFITAIKSKPFLLLAGISGTGKSRIVRELARACWTADSEEFKAQKPSNFEMVQVKPNWHDSSELIGYVSRIGADKDGNPRPEFVAGEFLRFIAKAWENPDIPYFLCLDEMNLAPVEQYFAEYLSVIESRKADGNGNVITDPILKSDDQWYFDLTAKLTQDDEVRTRFNTDGITIPQNLIVVGTVNMDETTFSFSRKVLDRAMTIEMNKVDLMNNLHKDQKFENIGKLSEEDLIGTAVEGVDVYDDNQAVSNMVLNYLQAINNKLEGKPFKIAYRTRNEFLLYVVNNLPYTQDEAGEDLSTEFVIARALDEITSMKVLSRIEGDESKVSKSFLEELKKVIKEQLEKIAGDVTFVAKVKENDTEDDSNMQHLSISLAKLDEMIKRLDSGYTSFWS